MTDILNTKVVILCPYCGLETSEDIGKLDRKALICPRCKGDTVIDRVFGECEDDWFAVGPLDITLDQYKRG